MRQKLVVVLAAALTACSAPRPGELRGGSQVWSPVEITFSGDEISETSDPNPFTDYRLIVTFVGPDGEETRVPGFYAADGNAAETSADSGNRWRVRFLPGAPGEWIYQASFRSGRGVALDADPAAGEPIAFDGSSGSFTVADAQGDGLLQYVGERYLKFAGSGKYFLKNGADSPENLLAYVDFDGTSDRSGTRQAPDEFLHRYQPHLRDWKDSDPTWQGGKGKGLIGGLNYLASQGVNSIYFLPQNIDGDGDDTWPWVEPTMFDRFDVSKLAQWEIVFDHAQALGILLHVVTAETENDRLLDGGDLGPERKLYYRELIARFAHHPMLIWNLGEENRNSDEARKAFSKYIHELDPYDHPVVMHTNSLPEHHEEAYAPLLGYEHFEGASMQIRDDPIVHKTLIDWMRRSREAGRPWIVAFDEQRMGSNGIVTDAADDSRLDERRDHLYATLMAGSWGIEWYFGYESFPDDDLHLEDWRTRETIWRESNHALEFFHGHLPFWEMQPADELTPRPDDFVLAKPGQVYAVYVPGPGSNELDLADGKYSVAWFNPRKGGALANAGSVTGPGRQSLGRPPSEQDLDWLALVRIR